MLITTSKHNTFSAMLANQWRPQNPGLISSVSSSIAQHPGLAVTDVLDLGAGISTTFDAVGGKGGDILKATSIGMGVYHGAKTLYHLVEAMNESEDGNTKATNSQLTKALGDGLTAAGQFCAVGGVGPVSLGFLGLGLLVSNLSAFSR